MVDGLPSTDDAEETQGRKANFVARIVESAVDKDTGGSDEFTSDIDLVYELEPIATLGDTDREYTENMNEFSLDTSGNPASKWMVFTHHFEQVWGSFDEVGIEDLEDLTDFLEDRVCEFRDILFDEEDVELTWGPEDARKSETLAELFSDLGEDTNQPNSMMVPVRELSDEEVAELGEEAGDVEEVDFDE